MNPILDQLLNRHSVRNFTDAPVRSEDLELILRAARQAPTSYNGQQTSLIVTRDAETISKIADLAGGQPQVRGAQVFVTVVLDYNRTAAALELAGEQQILEGSAEGLLAASIDAGIILNAAQTAANSLGYGTTAIGGIRANPEGMIDLLGLPKRTYPVAGFTLGVADPDVPVAAKPRLPLDSFAMNDRYNHEAVVEGVKTYDDTLRAWWDEIGLPDMKTYSAELAGLYNRIYFPKVAQTLKAQGFDFKDN